MQAAEKKEMARRREPTDIFSYIYCFFSNVSACVATHSFRDHADDFLPYLSTSSRYGLAVVLESPETDLLPHSSSLSHH